MQCMELYSVLYTHDSPVSTINAQLMILVVGRYCVAQGAVSVMVARVDVVVQDLMEVATKVVKVNIYKVSVGSEEFESLNTKTEMGKWSLSLLSGKRHYTLYQMKVGGV